MLKYVYISICVNLKNVLIGSFNDLELADKSTSRRLANGIFSNAYWKSTQRIEKTERPLDRKTLRIWE